MAGSTVSLFNKLGMFADEIATMTAKAGKKTAGLIGDDLAVNAEQVIGVKPDRELAVVKKVALGSLKNKAILIPAALALSAVAPWTITPLLMAGGAFLCYEGFHKVAHKISHSKKQDEHKSGSATEDQVAEISEEDIAKHEKKKIRKAINTDFILSAEITAIALGTVAAAPLLTQAATLTAIGLGMTAFVYGSVAGIVKIDDLGLKLKSAEGDGLFAKTQRGMGNTLLTVAPWMMKGLSVLGTAAMFIVGGEIIAHGVPMLGHGVHWLHHAAQALPYVGAVAGPLATPVAAAALGVVTGAAALGLSGPAKRIAKPVIDFVKSINPFGRNKDSGTDTNETKIESEVEEPQVTQDVSDPVAETPMQTQNKKPLTAANDMMPEDDHVLSTNIVLSDAMNDSASATSGGDANQIRDIMAAAGQANGLTTPLLRPGGS